MDKRQPRRKKAESRFGANLELIAKRRGLTHRQLAQMAEVSISTVGDWIGRNGRIPHDLAAVGRLARALKVPLEWLLLSESHSYQEPGIADLFDEVSEPALSGYFYIAEAKRLVPRGKR